MVYKRTTIWLLPISALGENPVLTGSNRVLCTWLRVVFQRSLAEIFALLYLLQSEIKGESAIFVLFSFFLFGLGFSAPPSPLLLLNFSLGEFLLYIDWEKIISQPYVQIISRMTEHDQRAMCTLGMKRDGWRGETKELKAVLNWLCTKFRIKIGTMENSWNFTFGWNY